MNGQKHSTKRFINVTWIMVTKAIIPVVFNHTEVSPVLFNKVLGATPFLFIKNITTFNQILWIIITGFWKRFCWRKSGGRSDSKEKVFNIFIHYPPNARKINTLTNKTVALKYKCYKWGEKISGERCYLFEFKWVFGLKKAFNRGNLLIFPKENLIYHRQIMANL